MASERQIIDMHQCPMCSREWIPDGTLVCTKCMPNLNTQLAIHDLYKAIEDLEGIGPDELLAYHGLLEPALDQLSRLLKRKGIT